MITRLAERIVGGCRPPIILKTGSMAAPIRQFSTTKQNRAKNRIYTSVRRPDDFSTYVLLSTSSRIPLITFWTASHCNTCQTISPLLQELISSGVGEAEGGVSFAEVEFDSQDIMDSGLASTYMITSMPTLLSFDRGEAQTWTKVTDPKLMKDREWLNEWIRTEAGRGGDGEAGLNAGGEIFGGLWGKLK